MRSTAKRRVAIRVGAVLAGLLLAAPAASLAGTAAAGATTPGFQVVTASPLPEATLGQAYGPVALLTAGGTAPISWTVVAGTMPPGLALSSTGVISGTPTVAGQSWVTFGAFDSSSPSQYADADLLIQVQNTTPVALTTTTLPGGSIGAGYSATIGATGGVPPYYFEAVKGSFPAGLTMDQNTGTIVGVPTQVGPWTVEICAEDSTVPNAEEACHTYSGTVTPHLSLTVSTALPTGTVGQPYTGGVTATGGTQPYTYAVTGGSLPPGLSLNPATGQLTGTPTTPGTSTFTITVTDSSNPTESASVTTSLTVNPGPLTVVTGVVAGNSLPQGMVGVTYSAMLQASGGTTPYSWTITSGALPPGLSLASNGAITGVPTTAGTYPFGVKVTDSSSPALTATASESITIVPGTPLTVVTGVQAGTALPQGIVGVPYNAALQATGGTLPYSWTITSGTLPPGLSLAPNGAITGTPTTAGTYPFAVKVTDASSPTETATANESITVVQGPIITTTTVPNAQVGQLYSTAINVVGGTAPYTWAITAGALPPGLSLGVANGVEIITGTPTTMGPYSFTVTVTDSSSPARSFSQPLTLTVLPAGLIITTDTALGAALPVGTVGVPYSATLTAAGGTPPYTWAITVGTLPAGLTLNPATGAITGTPTTAGTVDFTAQVTDSTTPVPNSATAPLGITINAQGVVVTGPVTSPVTAPLAVVTGTTVSNSLPGGTVGVAYAAALNASGGTPPYSWSLANGSLPPGLALSTGGTIAGTPTTAGTYSFTVKVTDSASPADTATGAESITISPAPVTLASGGGATGYRLVANDGGVFDFGGAQYLGSLPGQSVNVSDIVGIQVTPSGGGYWLVGSDGGIFAFGNAPFLGAVDGVALNERLVGMSGVPGGQGYREVGADGGIFDFGAATYQGSLPQLGIHVSDIVGMATTPDGNGYWVVGADGSVYAFGDAMYFGSLPGLNIHVSNIVSIIGTADGGGYWLVGSDGGVYSFGDAVFYGSTGNIALNSPVVGASATPDGGGYWLVAGDGGVFAFGDAPFDGSMGGVKLNQPAHGLAAALALAS